jgi:hypothetical protein
MAAELPSLHQMTKWELLMMGSEFQDGTGFLHGPEREAAIHAAWEENREALIPARRERYGAGWLPWAWWEYDAPTPIRAAIPPWVRSHVLDERLGNRDGFRGSASTSPFCGSSDSLGRRSGRRWGCNIVCSWSRRWSRLHDLVKCPFN